VVEFASTIVDLAFYGLRKVTPLAAICLTNHQGDAAGL